MAKVPTFKVGALNLALNPLLGDGQILQSLNVERDGVGVYRKRAGYISYLGTPDNAEVTTLFSWKQNDDTLINYRKSGSLLYYSASGTGAWTICGGGTLTNNSHVGHAIFDNILILGDGTAASRHSVGTTAGAAGTSFTNTTGAPLAEHWEDYQGRVYAARGTAVTGTNTDLFYSAAGTATNWTTDSSSIRIPGAGRVNTIFKSNDRLISNKDAGQQFRWDGYNLVDLATNLGPSSPYSVGNIEDYRIYLNRLGFFGYGGDRPKLLSRAIERQIYNDSGSGIAGTTFANAPGIAYKYDYFCGVGTITDDLTDYTIDNCIMKYNIRDNEWFNWKFANRPTAFGTYQDASGNQQMIFGDSGGQSYQLSGTALSDNGNAIESLLMGFIHGNSLDDKKWNWIRGMFNPGSRAKIQIAISDTITPRTLKWQDIGDTKDGVVEYRFPQGSRGKFLFWKIYELSKDSRWRWWGWEFDAEVEGHG